MAGIGREQSSPGGLLRATSPLPEEPEGAQLHSQCYFFMPGTALGGVAGSAWQYLVF